MKRKDQRGAAALEFALCLPFLCLFVFGIVVFGTLFLQKLALGNGAGTAARYGAVNGFTCDEVKAEAVSIANETLGMDSNPVVAADVSVTVGGVGCTSAQPPCQGSVNDASVLVVVNYTADVSMPFFADEVDLTGKGEFQCEYQ